MNESGLFERGVRHFNAGEFFEAHEVWEEIWLQAPQSEKPLLQGLIQIAAALHHYKRGNLTGAKSLLAAGIAKVQAFPDSHRGVHLYRLLKDLDNCGAKIQDSGFEPPQIHFTAS